MSVQIVSSVWMSSYNQQRQPKVTSVSLKFGSQLRSQTYSRLSLKKNNIKQLAKTKVSCSQGNGSLEAELTSAERRFHQNRLAATEKKNQTRLDVTVRLPENEDELKMIALLRARSFNVFPPERAFAGKMMVEMKAGEELTRLQGLRHAGALEGGEQVMPLLGLAPSSLVQAGALLEPEPHSPLLLNDGMQEIVGTLDVFLCGSTPDNASILLGEDPEGAYLGNVCVAGRALRRGVARSLVESAKHFAKSQGVAALYVHALAVNEKASALYRGCGFVIEKEESANAAKGRGGCLDGIEGRANIVLFKCNLE